VLYIQAELERGHIEDEVEHRLTLPWQYRRGNLQAALQLSDIRLALSAGQRPIFESDRPVMLVAGGWGSGKTTVSFLRLLRAIVANPRDPMLHGADAPWSVVMGPTTKILKETMMRTARALVPDGWIEREWADDPPRWRFRNGHMLSWRSFGSSFEGANLTAILVDEAHLISDAELFSNLSMRARDRRSRERVTIFCGLPLDGILRQHFDKTPEPPTQRAFFLSTKKNPFLERAKYEEYVNLVAHGEELAYLEGRWIQRFDSVFHTWSSSAYPEGNLLDARGSPSAVTHLAVDVGDAGFVLFAQVREVQWQGRAEKQLFVIDQLPLNNVSTQEMAARAKARGWRLQPGESKIYTDPTLRPDEIAALRTAFPGLTQVRAGGKDDPRWSIEYGIDAMKQAFRSATGLRRIVVASHLASPRRESPEYDASRGIVQCITGSRKDPRTGLPRKQNRKEEHGRDCLRYLTVNLLPMTRVGGARVIDHR
jgi:hypothetical protein